MSIAALLSELAAIYPPERLLSGPAELASYASDGLTAFAGRSASAADLGRRKATAMLGTGADAVATGNIGCITQIESQLRALGRKLPVDHTMELLAAAYHSDARETTASD